MKNILIGIFIATVFIFGFQYCEGKQSQGHSLTESSHLILEQINNVSKLIVTEGQFAEIFNFEDSKDLFFDTFSATKKALVVVNAKATISYDFNKVKTEIDSVNKVVKILAIPEPEINIYPDISYYDIQQDYFNTFEASDYNKIKEKVNKVIKEKINASNLSKNAKNRFITELQKIYLFTNSLGWKLEYKEELITNELEFQKLDF